jgi:hypothetical protein
MPNANAVAKSLRERFAGTGEDHLGRALSDLLDSPLISGTIGRAFDAREKAAQAQELAMGALNIPSAADIERLTRRLRAVSQRLEGIEDGVHRLDRALAAGAAGGVSEIGRRLSSIEDQLGTLTRKLEADAKPAEAKETEAKPAKARPGEAKPAQAKPAKPRARRAPAKSRKQA